MKKICFVTTIYLTYHCFLKGLSAYLHDSGYEVHLICGMDSVDHEDLPSFVVYHPVKMERGVSLSSFGAIRQIYRILAANKFDIVQYSTPNAAFYTSIAAKLASVPVRLYCQWGIRYMGFEGMSRRLFYLLEKITCRYSTFVEAESHGIRNYALQQGLYPPDKSCVVWNGSACGVDLKEFDFAKKEAWRKTVREKHGIKPEDFVFCFSGRLTADKGVNELFEAFLSLKDEHAKLIMLGFVDDESTLNKPLLEKIRHDPHVIFTGFIPEPGQYYAASDAFVSPSYREGFGLVAVEAQAMGLPAIVTDVPGQIDAILPDQTGLLCKVKDSGSLYSAMKKLIDDPDLTRRMGLNAERYVRESYDQKVLFEKLLAHREQLIGRA